MKRSSIIFLFLPVFLTIIILNGCTRGMSKAFDRVSNGAKASMDRATDTTEHVLNEIIINVENIGDEIEKTDGKKISKSIAIKWDKVTEPLWKVWKEIVDTTKYVWDKVTSTYSASWKWITDTVDHMVDWVMEAIEKISIFFVKKVIPFIDSVIPDLNSDSEEGN